MPPLPRVCVADPALESWRPVLGFESKYVVSDFGRVWSLTRGRLLALTLTPNGYVVACLSRPPGSVTRKVHRLALEAFRGPAAVGEESRHLDGDRTNNQLTNLRWGSRLENAADAREHGSMPGERETQCQRSGHERRGQNLLIDSGALRCRSCRIARNLLRIDSRREVVDEHDLAEAIYAELVGGAGDAREAVGLPPVLRGAGWLITLIRPSTEFRARDVLELAVATQTPHIDPSSVRAALCRARGDGRVERAARGLYRRTSVRSGG